MAYQKTVTVFVWDEPHVVTVYREHQSVWLAVGDYEGKSISVQDGSEGAVLKRWREVAKGEVSAT
jgi:hypothetical protein